MIRDLQISANIIIPSRDLSVSYARSGGPGGQNVNKVASKAILRFRPRECDAIPIEIRARIIEKLAARLTNEGEIIISASEHRDAPKNLESALSRLELLLRNAMHVPKKRKFTKPTRGSVEGRLQSKKARSNVKRIRRAVDE